MSEVFQRAEAVDDVGGGEFVPVHNGRRGPYGYKPPFASGDVIEVVDSWPVQQHTTGRADIVRYRLVVVSVVPQQLGEATEEDAIAEGWRTKFDSVGHIEPLIVLWNHWDVSYPESETDELWTWLTRVEPKAR